ncbi:MAG: Uma2 family endonuclease [Candidatus Kapabacteria bacterium]|jgi:Uma2 family endonuclease|nr:Uma2 family endonuclease [Candidatus Kapabacteria bacterium]
MEPQTLSILDEPVDDIDYDSIITEDGEPVDSVISEKNMRLLTEPLHANWQPPQEGYDGKFMALANVGLFYSPDVPALVPDAMLSLGVEPFEDIQPKKNRSYFIWRFGKPPEVVIEIVSNLKGNEYGMKMQKYAQNCGVRYYAIFDPHNYYNRPSELEIYHNVHGVFEPLESNMFEDIGLGLVLWEGKYENMQAIWLRWCDLKGNLIPTGRERAEAEKRRANEEKRRADEEKRRADVATKRASTAESRASTAESRAKALAAKLRALGINPDDVE